MIRCTFQGRTLVGIRHMDLPPSSLAHYDVTKWKHLPHYWPFVPGIHRSEAGDFKLHGTHYNVTLMFFRLMTNGENWEKNMQLLIRTCHSAKADLGEWSPELRFWTSTTLLGIEVKDRLKQGQNLLGSSHRCILCQFQPIQSTKIWSMLIVLPQMGV